MCPAVSSSGGRRSEGVSACNRILSFCLTYTLAVQSLWTSTALALNYWSHSVPPLVTFVLWHSLLLLMALWTHCRCMFTDPGRVPVLDDAQLIEDARRCGFTNCFKCQSPRPRRAHHCSVCGRCVLHMDHHCPWISNCVGLFNQKFFIQYNAYVWLSAVTDIALGSAAGADIFSLYANDRGDLVVAKYGLNLIIATVLYIFIAVLFALFTLTLLIDQLWNIYRNTTTIDKLKRIRPRSQPFLQSLKQVFGGDPSLRWLLPLGTRPRYLVEGLTPANVIALSMFDETDAIIPDGNHELQGLSPPPGGSGLRRRLCFIRCILCRWDTSDLDDA